MKTGLMVVSFGTSYDETRAKTIDLLEEELQKVIPEAGFKRAWTSYMIMRKILKRDGIHIKNTAEAMEEFYQEGYERVYVQPTHILNGEEYEKMKKLLHDYRKHMDIIIGRPMLNLSDDYDRVVEIIGKELDNIGGLKEDEALLLMGHGTEHHTDVAYAGLDYRFKHRGYSNIYIGTVEGFPELDDILPELKEKKYKKIKLMPFMIVAGDHAQNDMAGDEDDSWASILKAEGFEVECFVKGLGEIEGIRDIYRDHLREVIEK